MSDIPFDEMTKLDYLYVTNWSLREDLRLILLTFRRSLAFGPCTSVGPSRSRLVEQGRTSASFSTP